MQTIKVYYHDYHPLLKSVEPYKIKKIEQGDWIDLAVADDYLLKEGQHKLLSLGVSIELPKGYEAIVAPRSSTFGKYGILQTNSIGIIDNSYCGIDDVWKMSVYATRNTFIPAGTRVAQFRIQPVQEEVEIVEVDTLDGKSRGGFGSTGD